jgi:hypothetical protein
VHPNMVDGIIHTVLHLKVGRNHLVLLCSRARFAIRN